MQAEHIFFTDRSAKPSAATLEGMPAASALVHGRLLRAELNEPPGDAEMAK